MKRVIIALFVLLAAAPALASSYSGTATFFTRIHFTEYAWGKKVAQVYAHVGVLTQDGGRTYWDDVRHQALQLENGKFTGKVVLYGQRSSQGAHAKDVVLQYWVTFADGSQRVTEPFVVTSSSWEWYRSFDDQGLERRAQRQSELVRDQSIDRTSVHVVEIGQES